MPDIYAYVDPVSGNNGTAVISTTPATAAANPYLTLAAAETAGRRNLTTQGGDFRFRLLQGVDIRTTALALTSANWPGTDDTHRIIFEGIGTGLHNGVFSESTGYTLRYTGSGNQAISYDDVCIVLRDFRIRGTDFSNLVQGSSSNSSTTIERMMLYNNDGPVLRNQGFNAANRRTVVRNSVLMNNSGGRAIYVESTNASFLTAEHNTLIGNHATQTVVDLGTAMEQTFSWNYAHNIGAGAAYGGAGWAGSTRNKNASGDTSGDATYQSIAYATGSGARFTNVTGGSENFDIGAASTLKNAATDSSVTVDVLSRARSTPDIGAFENQSASAPSLSSATPSGTLGTSTTATLGATTDQASGTFYGVVDTAGNISGVTAAQVKAGQKNNSTSALASSSSAVSTTSPATAISGLTANTLYSYAVVQNNTNGDSSVLTGTFTTATAVPNPEISKYGPRGALRTIITL